jgi:DNA-binding MarR family transcriptional regulator
MRKTNSPPAAGEGKRGPDGYLGYLLRQAANAQRRRMERALADLDVTPPQFAALTMIGAYPGLSNAELARVAVLTPQTTNAIVANLERMGAIMRQRHAIHGRNVTLTLTARGKGLLGKCRARVMRVERDLAAGLGSAREKTIKAWLAAVAVVRSEGE